MSNGKAAIGILLAAICAVAAWSLSSAIAAPAVPEAPATDRPDGTRATTAEASPTRRSSDRTQVAIVEADTGPALDHPFSYDLQIEVRDRDGLPAQKAAVYIGPSGCALTKIHANTDQAGIVHAQWRGKLAEMDMVLRVENAPFLRRYAARAGAPQRLVVEGCSSPGTLERPDFMIDFMRAGEMYLQLHPFAVFGDQLAVAPPSVVTGGSTIGVNGPGHFTLHSVPGPPKPPTVLEGTIYDEAGKPVPSVWVTWGNAIDVPLERVRTDDQGNFRFRWVVPGLHELRAGGGDAGLARAQVEVLPEQTTRWIARLGRGQVIRGHAVDARGKPLAGWLVEAVGAQEPWFDACLVRDDGSWFLPNQPPGMATLLLRGQDHSGLAVLTIGPVLPDSSDIEFRCDAAATRGTLRIEPLLPDDILGAPVYVRVWQEDTGRAFSMQQVEDHNAFALAGLPAGWYRIEVGTSLGWNDAGRQWVDGRNAVDLGRFAVPRPGTLRIKHGDRIRASEKFEQQICFRRADCDVRVEDAQVAKGSDMILPAGAYWLHWRDPGGEQHLRGFTIRAGEEMRIDTTEPAIPDRPVPR